MHDVGDADLELQVQKFRLWDFLMAAKDVIKENAIEDGQGPRDEKLDLRYHKVQLHSRSKILDLVAVLPANLEHDAAEHSKQGNYLD